MGTNTLNSYTSTGITLSASGADHSPFTVTTTGTINTAGAAGVYGQLAAPYLLNEGSIFATVATDAAGILLLDGGTIVNSAQAVIRGELDGVVVDGAAGTVSNAGTINAIKSTGVLLTAGGTVINTGTITGGVHIEGAGSNRVVAGNDAAFIGSVLAQGANNTLEFSGAGGTVASIGTQFTGFQTIAFDSGAAWTISGNAAALTGLTAITGFGVGDQADLTGFAATSASYIAGTGLVLSNASASETIYFTGGPGVYGIGTDGAGGTDITFGTHTLSTDNNTGITLTSTGPYLAPFTVTPTGTIASSGYGVYTTLSAAYLLNQGTIIGGKSDGVHLRQLGGFVANTTSSAVIYGAREGVYNVAAVINSGTIIGKTGGVIKSSTVANSGTIIGHGFYGVGLNTGGTLINSGTIISYGNNGVGLGGGGTVTNSGTIAGAVNAVNNFMRGFTLNELAGGVFDGAVVDHAGNGILNLAGAAAGTLDMGGSFSGFSNINFGPAAWTLDGTSSELANSQTITGFTLGDKIDLTDFAATSASYVTGTGLVLSNASASETLHFTGGNGEIAITADGNGGTSIQFGTHTLSTATSTGITLSGIGPDLTPFTITHTGTILSGGYGVYSTLSGAYLLNQGTIILPNADSGDSVLFKNGGTVINAGTIDNFSPGNTGTAPTNSALVIETTAGTVTNTGSIIGKATDGIYLQNGGAVTNTGRSALISGYQFGVGGNVGTVLNTGTITATDTFGVGLYMQGGIVTNAASYALISGGGAGVGLIAADTTLTNSGTVTGKVFGVDAAGVGDVIANTGANALIESSFFPTVFITATDVTLINAGTIGGGADAVLADASGFTLDELAGGVFKSSVVDQIGNGLLNLAGSTAGTLAMGGSFSGFSALNFGPDGWRLDGSRSEIAGGQSITGFVAGDKLDITDLTFAASEILTLGPSNVLTVTQGTATLDITFSSADIGAHFTISSDGAGGTFITDDVLPCFCAGTRIRTPRGEVAVEDLAVGDEVITSTGQQPIKWIGQRSLDPSRHPRPEKVRPIRFETGCIAENMPARDLFLSPDHALYLDGILVPAKALLNGASIRQIAVPFVTYYHIELNEHTVIFAENTPAETYLETGNRGAFENGSGAITLHPDFAQTAREAKSCAPFIEAGAQVEAIRRRILDRAPIATTPDPAISIAYHKGAAIIQSHHAIPGLLTPDPRDRRQLGVKVASILVGGHQIALDHPALLEGWHDAEPDGRWTNGNAVIPAELLRGARDVKILLAATLPYPIAA